ncbi:hemicentin-1 isoform X2 [Mobula hypostoma]|uniref:hemicentin-1 isoform X2 n=1 Tax=Mobula hypostoma TaxID=723540 RepID=UPI002FC2ACDD
MIVPMNMRWEIKTFIVCLALLFCPTVQDAPEGGQEAQDVPEGASTLAFVFDVTGSMYDDLVQVIEGASKILEASLSRPKKPLYNFALIPFHDPEVGPVTITTDPKKFQYELRELYVQGGGDCPEMSISAIKMALEMSLPGSFIYVFTDARSKDYRLAHHVLQLIQQKQSQVVFVLTGDCDDRSHVGYKVYEEIASTSSGQVFHLDKKQVNEVLKWVKEAVQASKVHLLSTDHAIQAVNTWQIPFDPSLKQVTVSLSGPAPFIEIRDPSGKIIRKGSGLNELLHIANSARVVNIKNPQPGLWTIKTASAGRHSVRITGLSTIDFRAGFSQKRTMNFKKIGNRPVQGIPTYLLLNTSGLAPPARVDRVELLGTSGVSLKTLPIRYYPDRKPYSILNVTEFIPPDEAFFLKITGYDSKEYLFQRVSSVSYSNIVPGAPKVTMPAQTPGYYMQPGYISCTVESLIPFTLRFSRAGSKLGTDQFYKESASASFEILRVSAVHEGIYECIAISSAGTGRAQTFLDVSEPPPTIQVPRNVTAIPGERATLTCLTLSTVRYNLTWQRNGIDPRLSERHRVRVMSNLSLEIRNVQPADAGPYSCIAANEGGVASAAVYLIVQEPPRVTVYPMNQTFTEGREVRISCTATGYPRPHTVWTHNDMFLIGTSRHMLSKSGSLIIRPASQKDSGIYTCLGSSSAGTDRQASILTYIEAPKVTVVQKEILIGLGDTAVLKCKTTGVPEPEVKWFKGDLELNPSNFLSIDTHRGVLEIKETQELDAGDYTCLAVNDAGRASGQITLDVGSSPVFSQAPLDISMDIGSNLTLPCQAQGYPTPRIRWRRVDGKSIFSRHSAVSFVTQLRTGSLSFRNLWVDDETTYICEAENQFGKIQARATVTVTGLVKPLIGIRPAVVNIIEGQPLTLPCVLLAGNPLPGRLWIKNNFKVTSDGYVTVRRDGSLHIERIRLRDGGKYTCLASNVAGTSNRTTTVNIFVVPTIQHGPQIFSTIEGVPIRLPCKAHGIPKPSISWSKNDELIIQRLGNFSVESDGSLLILSPSGAETGEFVCTATNAAGYTTRKVQLTVYVKPRIVTQSRGGSERRSPKELSVIEGEDITLPCEVHSFPPPIIHWAKNMQLISPFSPRHTQLSTGSMKIIETRLSDSGTYQCVATNIAGNVTQYIRLSVHVPPRIRSGPRIIKVQAGQRIDIPCNAQGVPTPSVSWYKEKSNISFNKEQYSVDTEGTLTIKKVQLNDDGVYTCVAKNVAGQHEVNTTVQVHEPPTVEDPGPPFNTPFQERMANQRIAFPCPAKGIPKPVIKWLRNGRELTGSEPGVSILDDGTLLIDTVSLHDDGEYVCVAVNEAGSTERKYQLKVHVPPDIRDNEKPANLSVVINQPISLFCDVSGHPTPIISWYKDGLPVRESNAIQIMSGGKILRMHKTVAGDTGRYTCRTINIAGTAEKSFNLEVLVPPSIMGAGTTSEVSVILNQEATLECKVQGIPFPHIQWYKDNRVLFLGSPNIEVRNDGQMLHIKNARLSEQGHYQCSAVNAAGKRFKKFKLNIYVAPTIKGGNTTTDLTVLLNNPILLECEARGIPLPAITWYRANRPIISSPQATYIDRGHFLQIPRAHMSDAGQYTCRVTSVAGTAEKLYELDVYVPPNVEGQLETPQLKKVITNNMVVLHCEASGHPPPVLTWLKDGVPVKASNNTRILQGGRTLEILSVAVSNAGGYTCVASSIAGESQIKYTLDVLVPPAIEGNEEASNASVIVHNPLELECNAAGSPPPNIMWMKDGQPIKSAAGVQITANGQKLIISQAQITDTGRYQCVATNEAGSQQREFNVVVQVSPTIRSTGPLERSVVVHKTVILQCVANGIPHPTITWLKDGRPVNTARGNIKLEYTGHKLQIMNALLEDAGQYNCVATNTAGEAQQHIRLNVHEPPTIEDGGLTLNKTVIVRNPIELKCRASGTPVPAITWFKDNQPINTRFGASILNRGQLLQIASAQVTDMGVYRCAAINVAGAAEITYKVDVYVPPTISGSSDMVTVVVNNLVRLECEASGIPMPSMTWLKDGSPIASFSDAVQVVSGGRVLAITSAQISDTGKYTCVAVNAAGEQQRDIDLRVYVPPNIMGEEQNVSVAINQGVVLKCQSNAIPPPMLNWLKDGKPLFKKPGLTVSDDGSTLQIESTQVLDTGRYTCEAINIAGKTEKNYNLNILVPPSIQGSNELSKMTVIEGNLISLICESSGIPPPSLMWKKNGSVLLNDLNGQVRIVSGGRQLQISNAKQSDSASYTCVASNIAGTATKEYVLEVYARPIIHNSRSYPTEVIVIRRNDVTLECKAQGIPQPALTWLKDDRPLVNDRGVTILNGGQLLQIKDAHVYHTGRYTCVAVNVAGQVEKKYDLNVHVPPSISGALGVPENVSVLVKNPVILICEASGIPLPSITWLKDGQPISLSNALRILSGGRILRLIHAAEENSGLYSCVVTNAAGEEIKSFDLNVLVPPSIVNEDKIEDAKVKENQSITLSCEVSGNPVPQIKWLKDGELLTEDQHQILSSGRFLQIEKAHVSDTGRYTCIAFNTAGRKNKNFNLNVLVSPKIPGVDRQGIPEEVTVILNNPISLVCEAQSYPPAIITWLKDGAPFESNNHVQILPGGRTLQILKAQEKDAGRYTCIATNEAGEMLKNYEVKVYIPPTINKDDIPDFGLSPKEVKIKVNSTLTLECESYAIPAATLHWYKDGQPLQKDEHNTITANTRIIQIKNAQISDTGRYTCVATNIAGEDEKDYDVNVQVPPSFVKPENSYDITGNTLEGSRTVVFKDVVINNPISLYCETNAIPPPSLTWYKDSMPLTSNSHVQILPGGRVLQIPRAQVEDAGRYICVATNEAGEDSIQYELRVMTPPTIKRADNDLPEDIIVLVNKTAMLDCMVSGTPTPNITWLKDGQQLRASGPNQLLSNGRTLQILNAQVSDTGRYICLAENIAGNTEKYFNLNVHVPPSIMGINPENMTVVINNFFSLTCEATAFPPPSLSWLKDGKPLRSNTNVLILPGGRTVQLPRAKLSDGGKYTCLAMNQAGGAEKQIYLTVYVPPTIKGAGDSPHSVSVRTGNTAILECESNAVPPPIITWFKNSRPVIESSNIRTLANGQSLEITNAEVSDTGQYVCKATNIAGQVNKNFHLNVHVPPRIEGLAEETVNEVISNPVTFACDATGIPPPILTWQKNGMTIENAESLEMHILSGGSKLQIARSQLADSGSYTCVARNVEGMAHKTYILTIQVPPSISGSEMPSEVSVLQGENVKLVCAADGIPRPSVQWLKDSKLLNDTDDKRIRVSSNGSTLHINRTMTTDIGKYTCVASNSAGEEDRIFNLNVYVPPVIHSNQMGNQELTTILDNSINIECKATGSPPPQLNWLKNGLPLPISSQIRLLSAGKVLRIVRAQVSDDGTYTCVASNRAGVDNKHYNLIVHVPPRMDGAGSIKDLTIVKGNPAALTCITDGIPMPTLAWLKETQPLKLSPHMTVGNQGMSLQISAAEVEDSGTYTCVAVSEAGEVSKHFSLKVLDPPHINGSDFAEETSVVVNNPLELQCVATGIPAPKLTWIKDGRPLPQTDTIHVLRGGEVLRIENAQVQDTGRYTCLASSIAGDDDREYLVRVHVPPNIAGQSGPQDLAVFKNGQITLECKSDAVPPPTLSWLKDGKSLKATPRIRILSSGRYLQINNAELGDAAGYICVASNVAGKMTREFTVAVNVAPTIEGPQMVTAHVNQPVLLKCVVNGLPVPQVTWRKDGAILSASNLRYSFSEDGSLHIGSAQVTDTGRYLCMATNAAGTARKRIDVQIYVPPSIAPGLNNITILVNVQTTLACEASGIPKPTVSWKKNGRLLSTDQNQNMYRLLSSGSLVIISPTVEDTARYECKVSNHAGEDQKAIQLTVQVPPSIADEATDLLVTRLTPAVITCTASGVPEPRIHWTKDGVRLPAQGEGYLILSTGTIEISAAQLNHTGRYTCIAKNAAGSARRQVNLRVQEPPVIQPQPSTLEVILNNPITLPCEATGNPNPTITWQKEGISIDTTGAYTVLLNGGLQIARAAVKDTGTYMCVAQNPSGTALGKIRLRVQVPPVIMAHPTNYVVTLDKPVTMVCEAKGYPNPEVTWNKDGHPVSESIRQRILSTGALQIAFAQPQDTGRYTCTAANSAGSSSSVMVLTVHIPPSMHTSATEFVAIEQSQIIIPCSADGVPEPALTWQKDGKILQNKLGKYKLLPSGELLVENAVPDDTGSYTCMATNMAGRDTKTITLNVYTHPTFTELPGDVSLNREERLELNCAANGIPTPKVTWTFNNNIIPAQYDDVNGHSKLVIEKTSKDDSGTYVCTAENRVGSIKAIGFVYVKEPPIFDGDFNPNRIEPLGGNAILNCEVRGDPLPTIQWSKKGIHIPISNRIRQLHNGSLAIYGTVNEDAGDYKCIATNDAGVIERSVTLTLQSSPVFTVEPMDTIADAGSTVMLNCQAGGEPVPTVEWSRQGRPLIGNDRITVLSNSSLRLTAVQKEDTSEYECVARNLLGSVLIKITLTVQVHGGFSEWLKWRPCSVTCGQGVQKRLRLCNNPIPANGGRHCQGADSETWECQSKPCPVDGSWSEWGQWEECSRTCGQGNRTRTRSCSNPTMQFGGRRCEGKAVEAIMCNIQPCPVTGGWSSWLPWSPCSETCGKGTQTRLRLCNNPPPSFDGTHCEGQDAQTRVCKNRMCPVDGKWIPWVSWSACSVSCGGGTRQRARTCSNPTPRYGGRYCEGSDVQMDFCNSDPCPIHGNWGPWSSWGTCSRTCNRGQMRRYRTCDNPRPASGGRACAGADTQIHRCSTDLCPVHGSWGPWQAWNDCSATCGGGDQRRLRVCNNPVPLNGGRSCPGDGSQVSRCQVQPCPGGPQYARGSVIGNINNVEFGVASLNATIYDSSETGTRNIQAQIFNVPRSIGPAMRKLISILNPIYWTTAKEIGEAFNGYTLTKGVFRRETQVEFATGEILRMTHIARGLDSDGALLLDIVVNGYVLQLPSSINLNVKDYSEDYIQTGPGQIYAFSTRMFTVDDASIPYSWNHTITYDHNQGGMPFLVETLQATAIEATYSPLDEILEYKVHAIITKGDHSNQCPSGFVLDSVGPFCSDEDECAIRNPCSHVCHNAMGTYYCSCPEGLTISADGRTCQDIDECASSGRICRAGQDCENTIGSYRCIMRCSIGFSRTPEGLSCQDINECQEFNPCQHRCLNTIGSYRCACNRGYQLRGRRCMDINECRQNVCRPDQQCKNTRGGFRCIDLCPSGMTKAENGSCIDINECKDGTHQCRYNQICENTRGSYRCVCPRGYRSQGVGRPCIDIGECEQVPKPCAYQCINTPGSFKCVCPPGQHLLGDGKSCAGLERLPKYRGIYNFGHFPSVGSFIQQQQHFNQTWQYRSHMGYGSLYHAPFSRTGKSIRKTCPEGYEAKHGNCIDIDECENKEPCQHDCKNTAGSYQCLCPSGYRLMSNGKACHDVDECLEQNIYCGANRMCFNMRGSYQCIDTPCPPNYQRDPVTGFCLKNCPPNNLECALSPYALEYKLVALPFGIAANQDLIRLVAYTHDGVMHPRTVFYVVDEDPLLPFAIRDENMKGVVFTIKPLQEPQTYRMKVRASSYSANGNIEYQTTFIVYIAVSAYPY